VLLLVVRRKNPGGEVGFGRTDENLSLHSQILVVRRILVFRDGSGAFVLEKVHYHLNVNYASSWGEIDIFPISRAKLGEQD